LAWGCQRHRGNVLWEIFDAMLGLHLLKKAGSISKQFAVEANGKGVGEMIEIYGHSEILTE